MLVLVFADASSFFVGGLRGGHFVLYTAEQLLVSVELQAGVSFVPNGRIPVKEFIDSLTTVEKVFVDKAFERLNKYGRRLDRPHIAYLRDDIYELRVSVLKRSFRFLFFYFEDQIIVMTYAMIKKGDKVRDSEIEKAIEYKLDYEKNADGGTK